MVNCCGTGLTLFFTSHLNLKVKLKVRISKVYSLVGDSAKCRESLSFYLTKDPTNFLSWFYQLFFTFPIDQVFEIDIPVFFSLLLFHFQVWSLTNVGQLLKGTNTFCAGHQKPFPSWVPTVVCNNCEFFIFLESFGIWRAHNGVL